MCTADALHPLNTATWESSCLSRKTKSACLLSKRYPGGNFGPSIGLLPRPPNLVPSSLGVTTATWYLTSGVVTRHLALGWPLLGAPHELVLLVAIKPRALREGGLPGGHPF